MRNILLSDIFYLIFFVSDILETFLLDNYSKEIFTVSLLSLTNGNIFYGQMSREKQETENDSVH